MVQDSGRARYCGLPADDSTCTMSEAATFGKGHWATDAMESSAEATGKKPVVALTTSNGRCELGRLRQGES